jgi:ATPase family protein associated with various cellular activities (AAA)
MADNTGNAAKRLLDLVQARHTEAATGLSQEEKSAAAAMALLAEIGGARASENDLTFEGTKFILPSRYDGRIPEAVSYLNSVVKQQQQYHDYNKVFDYRPYDVANALQLALKEVFGTSGLGETIQGMFGPIHPEFVEVPIGVGQSIQVPYERVAFPPLGADAYMNISHRHDREKGFLGYITIHAPRAAKPQVEGLFKVVEAKLRYNSIYRGKALIGGDQIMPQFLDVRKVNPDHVIYSDSVLQQLNANVWSLIEHTDLMKELGESLKRAVLLEGPYGTGKSLAAFLTAQRAVANGWTFLFVRPGDDLDAAMRTAQLYAPAVVFFEDIDVIGDAGDPAKVSKLLDSFDGIGAKGAEVIAVLTTNRKDKIHKGMLRPGRLDAVITINQLDQEGVKKLIASKVPADMISLGLDYAAIYASFKDFTPAFAAEAISRTKRFAIARLGGKPDYLSTEDFIGAADSLRPQLELMREAAEEKTTPSVDKALQSLVADVVDKIQFVESDGDKTNSYDADGLLVDRESLI